MQCWYHYRFRLEVRTHLDCRRDAEKDKEKTDDHQDDHPSQTEVELGRDGVGLDGGVSQPPANLSIRDSFLKLDPRPGAGVEVVASGEQVIHQQGLKHYSRDVAGPQ